MLNNFDHLAQMPGVVFKKFCGMSDEESTCTNEAVGEIMVVDEGITIPIPVCEIHLAEIQSLYNVDDISA